MDENQFVMVSEWMGNGNINEFIRSHKDVDRFELVGFSPAGAHISLLIIFPTAQRRRWGTDIHPRSGNGAWRPQGGASSNTSCASPASSNRTFFLKVNILIDWDGRARVADFGFLAVISDPANPTASSSYSEGGTVRWMSPELLAPDQTRLKNNRPTKQSDCYALGMVIYEVLAGHVPFAPFGGYTVMRMVMDGEHPQRPRGVEGAWFTNDLWRMLNLCWATRPEDRPSVSAVLEFLERVSGDTKPTPLQVDENSEADEDDWHLANNFSGGFSWFDPRRFIVPLRNILC